MFRTRPACSSRSALARAGAALWAASVWLITGACEPGVATPMPEPPVAFDLARVNEHEIVSTAEPLDPDVHVMIGSRGAVPPGAVVRATNLDEMLETAAVNAAPQGSFELAIWVLDGQELRFEWVDGQRRSAPADAVFVLPDPTSERFELVPSPRFDCLRLDPGFVLDLGETTQATLSVTNDCGSVLGLANARTRLTPSDFTLPALPSELSSGESVALDVGFEQAAPGPREDIFFVDVTLGAETIRYPITLRRE